MFGIPAKAFKVGKRIQQAAAVRTARLRFRLLAAPQGAYQGKVFCIGRNKTGTTSLASFFSRAGYRLAPQQEGEAIYFRAGFRPTAELWEWIDRYDVFQDAPFSWSSLLPELVQRHPDAKFILSVRDPNEWHASLLNHLLSHLGLTEAATDETIRAAMKRDTYVAPGYAYAQYQHNHPEHLHLPIYGKSHAIAAYLAHNALARRLLAEHDFLELDLSLHDTTAPLCQFLRLPDSFRGPMPRSNRRR